MGSSTSTNELHERIYVPYALQAARHAARRQARLAVLGFEELAAYLHVRRVEQGWPLAQIQAELGVGRYWLRAQLDTIGHP